MIMVAASLAGCSTHRSAQVERTGCMEASAVRVERRIDSIVVGMAIVIDSPEITMTVDSASPRRIIVSGRRLRVEAAGSRRVEAEAIEAADTAACATESVRTVAESKPSMPGVGRWTAAALIAAAIIAIFFAAYLKIR